MSKKKNEQPEAAEKLNKKYDKTSKENKAPKGKEQEFTITANLIDCSYCEALQKQVKQYKTLIQKYEYESKAAQELIATHNKIIKAQDKAIDALRRHVERLNAASEFFSKCLDWAAEHLGFFARRRYKKVFSKEAFTNHVLIREANNLLEEKNIEVDEDEKMLKEILDLCF